MLETLNQIEQSGLESLQGVQDEDAVQLWKINQLGRSSPLMRIFDQLGSLPKDERPVIGRRANEVKRSLEGAFEAVSERIRQRSLLQALAAESLDVTLPGRSTWRGRPHPATQSMDAISAVFVEMGFQIYRSREVELDEYNFQLLNFPLHHPAREMQDSFYVESGSKRGDNPVVLRTHTSPGQVRAMRAISALNPSNPPAVRLILPGMCFRFEQVTARSEMQFNQIEGLAVGKQITFGDLKGTLSEFARRFFGPNVHSRFRASHFPFTEPSAEMDIECFVCGGSGCQVCKRSGWLEILGCGMVHPVVLSNGGYDPAIYTGFAFGMGPERVAMLRYKIEDIRSFWANDLRFLEQF